MKLSLRVIKWETYASIMTIDLGALLLFQSLVTACKMVCRKIAWHVCIGLICIAYNIYIYNIYIYIYILYDILYDIHHWRIIWSSYIKLARVGFEPTTTEFHSDTPTDWAIRPWVQLALTANFEQTVQFHRLFSVKLCFGCCLCHSPRLFWLKFSWRNHMSVAGWMIHMVLTIEELFEIAIKSWPDWDLNSLALNSIQTL